MTDCLTEWMDGWINECMFGILQMALLASVQYLASDLHESKPEFECLIDYPVSS